MTEPTDALRLEKIRADFHTHADAAEPVHIFVSDVKALLRIIDQQNAVVEAARQISFTSRLDALRMPGGWTQFNARLLVEAKEIDKAFAELDANK